MPLPQKGKSALNPISGRDTSAVSTDRPRFLLLSGLNSSYPAASAASSHALPRGRGWPATIGQELSLTGGHTGAGSARGPVVLGSASGLRRVSHVMPEVRGTVC